MTDMEHIRRIKQKALGLLDLGLCDSAVIVLVRELKPSAGSIVLLGQYAKHRQADLLRRWIAEY